MPTITEPRVVSIRATVQSLNSKTGTKKSVEDVIHELSDPVLVSGLCIVALLLSGRRPVGFSMSPKQKQKIDFESNTNSKLFIEN